MPLNCICQQCGAPFSTYPSRLKIGKGKFCSQFCSGQNKSAMSTLIRHFWERVDKNTDCWLWLAGFYDTGYGAFNHGGAHRFSYELHYGPIPDGLWVLHHCDEPACVRPDHLFLGTSTDNHKDMVKKHRHVFGARHHKAKLTEPQVRTIRQLCEHGANQYDIAREFGISQPAVSAIIRRETWKHVQ